MKRKVLKYLAEWPDVKGEIYKVALKPEHRVTPFDGGQAPKYEGLRYLKYRMEPIFYKDVPGYAWVFSGHSGQFDIEVVDNFRAHEPIAFKSI